MEHPLERPPYEVAPESDTMGLRHVELALRDLPFPATTSQIRERAGNWRMPITGNHHHTLSEFMEGLGERRFRSSRDFARAIGRANRTLKE